MNTNLQMLTNKTRSFFRHSSEGWNPVVMVVAAVFLFAVIFTPSGLVFANHPCGNSDEFTNAGYDHECGQGGDGITTISGLIFRINAYLNVIVPFLVGIAVFVVIWGIFGYISHSAEEEKRQEARQFILWGVIFIFFMLSVWGLVNILNNSFNLKKTPIDVPSVFPTSP